MTTQAPAAEPQYDELFDYPRAGRPRDGRCRLRVFAGAAGPVILATDLGDENPGASVTNAAGTVATTAYRRLGLDPARTVFVEHYDSRVGNSLPLRQRSGQTFDRVRFSVAREPQGVRLSAPAWQPLSKADVERLIGGSLP